MDIQQLAQLLDQAMPGLGEAIMGLSPEAQQALVSIFLDAEQSAPGSGVQAVIQVLQDQVGGDTGGAPMDPTQGVSTPPPAGGIPPDGMVGGVAGAPPGGPGGQMTGPVQRPRPQMPQPLDIGPKGRKVFPYPKVVEVPKYELPPIPKNAFAMKPPTVERILEDARVLTQKWKPRDTRIDYDLQMWRGEHSVLLPNGTQVAETEGLTTYRSVTPFTYVQRCASSIMWANDRVEMDVRPRSDDDDHKHAAQKYENAQRTWRDKDSARFFARAEIGDPQGTLELHEATSMVLLGGMGWRWDIDAEDKQHPYKYEPIPVNQIYPGPNSTVRVVMMKLKDARTIEAINKYYGPAEDGQDSNEEMQLAIADWSDRYGIYHAMTWYNADGSDTPSKKRGDRWIQKPEQLGLGFPIYNMRVAFSIPAGPTYTSSEKYEEFIGFGVLTRTRKLHQFVDMVKNAIIMGAVKAMDPATLQTHAPGTDLNRVPTVDLSPGARNFGFQQDDVKPLVFAQSANADWANMVSMLLGELADVMPPTMRGQAAGTQSGYQFMQVNENAEAGTIGPLMDAMERTYQAIFEQRGILALRFGKGDKKANVKAMFDEYPYKGYRQGELGRYGTLKPEDIELSGVDVEVRYHRLTPAEEAALANMLVQLTNAHLMSVEEALKRRGVREPEREWLNILKDGGMLNPRVLMGLMGAAIMNSGNELLMQEWVQSGMLEMMQGQQGSQPRETGTPSAPNVANMPGGAPADVAQPGASSPLAA